METFGNIWATSGQTGLEQHFKVQPDGFIICSLFGDLEE